MPADEHRDSDKRVIRTKRAIKSALFELMKTKDFPSITISELAVAANVNRRTFYTHYKSVTDILTEIESELVDAIYQLIEKIDRDNYKDSIYKLFIEFHNLISIDFDYYFSLIRFDMRGILMHRLKSAIMIAAESHISIPENSCFSTKLAAAYIAGGFVNSYIEWSGLENKPPIEDIAKCVSMFSEGVIRSIKQ